MIKHIVMWNIERSEESNEKVLKFKRAIEGLKEKIDVIVDIEVGLNTIDGDGAKDIALYSVFENVEDLEYYQEHEEHKKAVAYGKGVLKNRTVIDYII